MNAEQVPRLLRCADLGLVLEYQVHRKWTHVIARDARAVFVKKVSNDVISRCGKVVDYPKGLVEAARMFLNPSMGIAAVTPEAQTILEDIMKTYSTKAAAVRGIKRMGGDPATTEIIKQDDGKFGVDECGMALMHEPRAEDSAIKRVPKKTRVNKNEAKVLLKAAKPSAIPTAKDARTITLIKKDETRRGDFGLIVDAVRAGRNTASAIVKALPAVDAGYIGRSISWGIKNGVFK